VISAMNVSKTLCGLDSTAIGIGVKLSDLSCIHSQEGTELPICPNLCVLEWNK
jgi:hypothetical protein